MRQIKATNTSVRDFPQVAVVSNQKIMIKSYVGKELAGRFSFDRSVWPECLEVQIQLLKNCSYLFGADPSLFANGDEIVDAQIEAINEALLKFEDKDSHIPFSG